MEDQEYIHPSEQDILLTDVKEEDLKTGIANALDVSFLEETTDLPSWPVEGILFGHNSRPFVCMYMKIKAKCIKVFFLVDTGSPHTYVSETTMNALGASAASGFRSTIHGVFLPSTYTSPNNSHYADINILGADFLNRGEFKVELNYGSATIKLHPGK